MALAHEIKLFTKNTLIVTLFFALALELSWDYVGPMLGMETRAGSNDTRFQQVEINYLGSTATALSLALGQQMNTTTDIGVSSDVITIAEVLARPADGQRRLIGTHMQAIQTYVSILETDIPALLDGAGDRTQTLDEHMAILKSYGIKTNDSLVILDEQISDLRAITEENISDTSGAKSVLQGSLSSLDYNGVDGAIENYTNSKNSETRARIYLIYLERFRDTYQKLQSKNKSILTVLSENRESIIKKSVIVIPDTNSDLLRELGLIQSEAEYKAQETLD